MNLSHDLTVIYGRNAQGKTNLLEGLYYAAMGFSFRSRHDEELVKFGETDCAAEVTYCDRYGENRLLVKRIQEGKGPANRPNEMVLPFLQRSTMVL